MSYTYLQDAGEESSAASFSDITLFAPLKSSPTAARCSCNGSGMECCHASQSGTTCEPSTASLGEGGLMSSAGDSHARTSAAPARARASEGPGADCGEKWHESFAKWNPDTSSWKIRQIWLFEGLDESLETWPRWGMMRNGECSEPATLAHRTSGPGFGFLALSGATALPTSGEIPRVKKSETGRIPTPTATDYKRTPMKAQYANRPATEGCPDDLAKWAVRQSGLSHARLVPDLWEWAMGWPLMWTGLKPLETAKFQAWRRSHGESFQTESRNDT